MKTALYSRFWRLLALLLILPTAFETRAHADVRQVNTIKDSATGITFKYPAKLRIEHQDNWYEIPSDGLHGTEGIYWNVFSTDFFTGTIRERAENFASNLAATDGEDGGTIAKPVFLGTEKSKTSDDVLLIQLKIHGYGNSSDWEGRIAGYMLAVDLKSDGKRKYRHLFIYAPSENILHQIAKSIEIPSAISNRRN